MRKVGKDVLIGKILPDDPTGKIVPTRAKRKSARDPSSPDSTAANQETAQKGLASPKYIRSKDILDAIAEKHGIDEDIYALLEEDTVTAQKLISCARFLTCTDGERLSNIAIWQLMHPIPYVEGLSEDICRSLTEMLGNIVDFGRGLFTQRLLRQQDDVILVAYDTASYPQGQSPDRYGVSHGTNGLTAIKLLSLYAEKTNEPLGFTLRPNNIPDAVSVKTALSELPGMTPQRILLVTDSGFYSETTAHALIADGFRFLMRIDETAKWVNDHLEACLDELLHSTCSCSEDGFVVGLTKTVAHCFQKEDADGTAQALRKRVSLHFFLDTAKRAKLKAQLCSSLSAVLNLITHGTSMEGLSPEAQHLAKRYIRYKTTRNKQVAYIDDQTVAEDSRYYGIFTVIGHGDFSQVRDTKLAFQTLIRREHIEHHFRPEKPYAGETVVRSWYSDNVMGRLIIQFIALLYEDTLNNEIRRIARELEDEITRPERTAAGQAQNLLAWLHEGSPSALLSWFDVLENAAVSSQIKAIRWNSEVLERDRMFLKRLGVKAIP
ncbi:MAG: hypothetical protein IJ708_07880 [Clostridia bacterium]|nr:hypothetical protein [Clostridia bacterium]MBR2287086.1 hypothetical protein [Clostridia bacterium]